MIIRRYRNGVLVSEEKTTNPTPTSPPATPPAKQTQKTSIPIPTKPAKKGCGCGKKKP